MVDPYLLERIRSALADRYAIEREVGRGGMAVVYLARDPRHGREVAVKVLMPDLAANLGVERFLREIETAARLNHPHILPLHDSGSEGGYLFYVMPYATGESLRDRLNREGQLPVNEAVRFSREIAGAIDYAHRQGVIHRDIKPDNILISDRHAVLTDFGVARAISAAGGDRLTATGVTVGTPRYSSPEQLSADAKVDARTDIYSLGCVLYEMLSGEVPLVGATLRSTRAKRATETPTPLSLMRDAVGPELDAVIVRSLSRIPADRYATAGEFREALRAATTAASASDPLRHRTPAAHTPGAASQSAMAAAPPGQGAPPPAAAPPGQGGQSAPSPRNQRFRRALVGAAPLAAVVLAAMWYTSRKANPVPDGGDAVTGPRWEQLTHTSREKREAVFSPDGRAIAIAEAEPGGGFRIGVNEIRSSEPFKTLAVVDDLTQLRWLPDGSGLEFWGAYLGRQGTYTVAREGGAVRLVSEYDFETSPDGAERAVVVVASGRLLIFTEGEDGTYTVSDSLVMEGDFQFLGDATYSPRGDVLAVTAIEATGGWNLWLVRRDGSGEELLVETSDRISGLMWREDGEALYYTLNRPSGRELIRVPMLPSGEAAGSPRSIMRLGDSLWIEDIWSDATRLLAAKSSSDERLVILTPGAEGEETPSRVIADTEGARSFAIAPDGETMAFVRKTAAGSDIYTAVRAGRAATRITTVGTVSEYHSHLAWSPDGSMLAFIAPWQDTARVWLVPAEGGSPVRLVGSRPGALLAWHPGSLMYNTPDNRNTMIADSIRVFRPPGSVPLTAAALGVGDSAAAVERLLVPSDSPGWVFHLITSPDGERVALFWNRRDARGLWVMGLEDGEQTHVAPTGLLWDSWVSLSWSADGRSLFWHDGREIRRFSVSGTDSEIALTPPGDATYHACERELRDDSFICVRGIDDADVWLVSGLELAGRDDE
jgi:Tol biopolymer transport system component